VDAPLGNRISRFWAAFTGTTAYLPLVIVDSGHQVLTGNQSNFTTAFQNLVDPELLRPPAAEIEAYSRQVGTQMRVYARLLNTGGPTLLASANMAALTALVYEDAHVGVTGRIMRAAPWIDITVPLPPDGVLTATINSPDLSGVNWTALHTVVVADYVPGPGTAYDMLQAAVAAPAGLSVDPAAITVGVDTGTGQDRSVHVQLAGPYVLTWTAASDAPWLAAAPGDGTIADEPSLTVRESGLALGSQEGHLTFSATSEDGMAFTQSVSVTAFLGPRLVRVAAAPVVLGSPISLPVVISALGDEHEVGFSLAFDPTVLSAPTVTLGTGAATAALTVDDAQAAGGRVGITVTLPAGQAFPQGNAQLVVVTFDTPSTVPRPTATVALTDQPVARSIGDAFGSQLSAAFEDATLIFPEASVVRTVRRHLGVGGP
jgi:hypothetical protein